MYDILMNNIVDFLNLGVTGVFFISAIFFAMRFTAKVTAKFTNLTRDVEDNTKGVAENRANIQSIFLRLTRIETILVEREPMRTKSPRVLNDIGLEVAKAIDADGLAKRYAHTVELPEDANAYHIQEACLYYARTNLLSVMEKEDRERVEIYAFETGDDVFVAQTVIGLKLRDVILAERYPEAFKMVSRGLGKKKANKKRASKKGAKGRAAASSKAAKAA